MGHAILELSIREFKLDFTIIMDFLAYKESIILGPLNHSFMSSYIEAISLPPSWYSLFDDSFDIKAHNIPKATQCSFI